MGYHDRDHHDPMPLLCFESGVMVGGETYSVATESGVVRQWYLKIGCVERSARCIGLENSYP